MNLFKEKELTELLEKLKDIISFGALKLEKDYKDILKEEDNLKKYQEREKIELSFINECGSITFSPVDYAIDYLLKLQDNDDIESFPCYILSDALPKLFKELSLNELRVNDFIDRYQEEFKTNFGYEIPLRLN